MKKLITLIVVVLLVSGCATNGAERMVQVGAALQGYHHYDMNRLNRAAEIDRANVEHTLGQIRSYQQMQSINDSFNGY